jgi:hypothetical protein
MPLSLIPHPSGYRSQRQVNLLAKFSFKKTLGECYVVSPCHCLNVHAVAPADPIEVSTVSPSTTFSPVHNTESVPVPVVPPVHTNRIPSARPTVVPSWAPSSPVITVPLEAPSEISVPSTPVIAVPAEAPSEIAVPSSRPVVVPSKAPSFPPIVVPSEAPSRIALRNCSPEPYNALYPAANSYAPIPVPRVVPTEAPVTALAVPSALPSVVPSSAPSIACNFFCT